VGLNSAKVCMQTVLSGREESHKELRCGINHTSAVVKIMKACWGGGKVREVSGETGSQKRTWEKILDTTSQKSGRRRASVVEEERLHGKALKARGEKFESSETYYADVRQQFEYRSVSRDSCLPLLLKEGGVSLNKTGMHRVSKESL